MANPHKIPGALEELQNSIYRDRILRARRMTPEERLDAVFELSEFQLNMLHAGEMHRHSLNDPAEGWNRVAEALDRVAKARDVEFFTKERPSS